MLSKSLTSQRKALGSAPIAQSRPAHTTIQSNASDAMIGLLVFRLNKMFGTRIRTVLSNFKHDHWGYEIVVVFSNNRTATTMLGDTLELPDEFLALCSLIYDLPEE